MIPPPGILSFDVEEHFRIEAAVDVVCSRELRVAYGERMEWATRKLLEMLAAADAKATFFVVGELAESHPRLVRDIHAAGHEIGSHSWDHRRVHRFEPRTFRADLLRSKEALEQLTGEAIYGFRAPTFSVVRSTGWALDVLAECGFTYDSSIFPIRHDRYGVHDAPRGPFWARGQRREILELPPTTYRLFGQNLPVAGGGYFRLFPLAFMRAGLHQLARTVPDSVGMLYFHPWEFDPEQPRLPLSGISRWRTYVGMRKSTRRLGELLRLYRFRRAIDVARDLSAAGDRLPHFRIAEETADAR